MILRLSSFVTMSLLLSLNCKTFAGDTGKVLEFALKALSSLKPNKKSYKVKLEENEKKNRSVEVLVTFELEHVPNCRRLGKVEKLPITGDKSIFSKKESCVNSVKKIIKSAQRMNGNTVLLNSNGSGGNIESYNAIAYDCKK